MGPGGLDVESLTDLKELATSAHEDAPNAKSRPVTEHNLRGYHARCPTDTFHVKKKHTSPALWGLRTTCYGTPYASPPAA